MAVGANVQAADGLSGGTLDDGLFVGFTGFAHHDTAEKGGKKRCGVKEAKVNSHLEAISCGNSPSCIKEGSGLCIKGD